MKILCFFILAGFAFKNMTKHPYESIMSLFEGIYEVFQKIVNVSMIFLPLGLWSLLASQASNANLSIILSLVKLVILIYVCATVFIVLSVLVIRYFTKTGIIEQLRQLKEVIIICLCTRNSYAAIPSATSGLSNLGNLDKNSITLSTPLLITLCRYGTLMTFSIASVYAAELYGKPIAFNDVIIICIITIFASMATSGAPGLVAKSMMGMVLQPLGIPYGTIFFILIAIDPIIDPVITLMNVYPNCASAAVISAKKREVVLRNREEITSNV